MPDEARLLGAVLVSLLAVQALTPVALRVAARTDFFDHPVGYKAHAAPTPYLGGAAVVGAFVVAAVLFGQGATRFWPIVACALGLAALGTVDDRVAVPPRYRLAAELAAAAVIWNAGLGWEFLDSRFEELILTSLWVLGFTNALNLMDNLDGAASSVGAACAAGIAVLAMAEGDPVLAAFAGALAGACAGFLRFNLRRSRPASIFLGDGGSMPLGFLVAALAMNVPGDIELGWPVLLVGGLLLGIPVLDTALVIVSRTRRGISLMTGGRDHLTHRLNSRLNGPWKVASMLAAVQFCVSLLALAAHQAGRTAIIVLAMSCLTLAGAAITFLERPQWTSAHVRQESGDELTAGPRDRG